jgi:hypothetical protein
MEAGYASLQGYYKARQLKRIEAPSRGQSSGRSSTRVRSPHPQEGERGDQEGEGSGDQEIEGKGTVTIYGRPYNMGKWRRDSKE